MEQDQVEQTAVENQEPEHENDQENNEPNEPENDNPIEDELETIVFGNKEAPPQNQDDDLNGQPAPQWVKDLRKADKEKTKRIKELEQQLNANKHTEEPEQVTLGKRPTLEECDYDSDEYDKRIDEWYETKRKVEAQAESVKREQEAQQQQWNATIKSYEEKKAALKARDFEEVELDVQNKFNQVQIGMILHGADNPARVIYALGKNPDKLEQLSKLNDPTKFAFAVAKMETEMKDIKRKAATAPERTVKGSAGLSGTVDSKLEQLRNEAERTGDYSKVYQYKQSMKK